MLPIWQAILEGEKKCEKKGEHDTAIRIALLLLDDFNDETIAEKTGLRTEEVRELRYHA